MIPVLGWVRACGCSRCCDVALSPAHLRVEVVTGIWCAWALVTPSALTGVLAVAGIGLVCARCYHHTMTGAFLFGGACAGHGSGTPLGQFTVLGTVRCGWCSKGVPQFG